MADVTVYGVSQSSYVWSTRIGLNELGVEHDLVPHMPHSEDQLNVHPFGRVPAFSHGDVQIFETMAILRYANRVFDGSLWPSEAAEAARVDQWGGSIGYLWNSSVPGLIHPRLLWPSQGKTADEDAIRANLPKLRGHLAAFDGALSGRTWIGGETLSAADILLGPLLAYISMTPEGDEAFEGFSNIQRFLPQLHKRDSFRTTSPS